MKEYSYSRLRVLLFYVDIRIMVLSCVYFSHSGDTELIQNLQFETKIGRK